MSTCKLVNRCCEIYKDVYVPDTRSKTYQYNPYMEITLVYL